MTTTPETKADHLLLVDDLELLASAAKMQAKWDDCKELHRQIAHLYRQLELLKIQEQKQEGG